MHRAGSALAQPATEPRTVEAKIVTQRIQERHLGIVDIDAHGFAVDVECYFHGILPLRFAAILLLVRSSCEARCFTATAPEHSPRAPSTRRNVSDRVCRQASGRNTRRPIRV